MDLQKIELLIKKINQAIKTIQKLKEAEVKYQEEIKRLTNQNQKIMEENLLLNERVGKFEEELQNNNILHKDLENKIVEILKFLPDEDTDITANITIQEENKTQDNVIVEKSGDSKPESEEEMLKNFVQNQNQDEESSLFYSDDSGKPPLEEEIIETLPEKSIFDEPNPFEKIQEGEAAEDPAEKIKKEFEIKFEETLLDDSEKDDIDFSFEESKNSDDTDLPKGVL
jgi:hypothetical protein